MEPFALNDCALIAIAVGEKARNLRELNDRLKRLDDPGVTYFHFWGGLLRPRFVDPEYPNDFAAWSFHDLHDRRLAERLSLLNPAWFESIDALRSRIVDLIEDRMDEDDFDPHTEAENPFFFMRSQIVVFDTRQRIGTPEELCRVIPKISLGSLFYHFIDARRRTRTGRNDFSEWLSAFGETYAGLADAIGAVDPYFNSLTDLRQDLCSLFTHFLPEGGEA